MLLPVIRGAESDDLSRRHILERKPSAGDDLDRWLTTLAQDFLDGDREIGCLRIENPKGGKQSRGSRKLEAGASGFEAIGADRAQRTKRSTVDVSSRIGDCQR